MDAPFTWISLSILYRHKYLVQSYFDLILGSIMSNFATYLKMKIGNFGNAKVFKTTVRFLNIPFSLLSINYFQMTLSWYKNKTKDWALVHERELLVFWIRSL